MKRIKLFLLSNMLLIAACSAQPLQNPLVGSEWTLLQVNDRNIVPGTHVEINFEQETFSGYSGCNSYGGRYQLSGSSLTVLEGIESTAAFCETPEGLMDQEAAYFSALTAASTFALAGEFPLPCFEKRAPGYPKHLHAQPPPLNSLDHKLSFRLILQPKLRD